MIYTTIINSNSIVNLNEMDSVHIYFEVSSSRISRTSEKTLLWPGSKIPLTKGHYLIFVHLYSYNVHKIKCSADD